MFRGSPGLSTEQLANISAVMGGNFNANTRESITQYLFTVPAEDIDVALHIEALRMQGVLDTAQGWDQERGAIEQEVAQDRSSPGYVLYESSVRSCSAARYMRTTRLARAPRSTRPPPPCSKLPRHLVRPQQRGTDHCRRRRAGRNDCARYGNYSAPSQSRHLPPRPHGAPASGEAAVLQRRYRPAGRHADDRDAHAGTR